MQIINKILTWVYKLLAPEQGKTDDKPNVWDTKLDVQLVQEYFTNIDKLDGPDPALNHAARTRLERCIIPQIIKRKLKIPKRP